MVTQHYRWDFVGLSTDTKPTPATSEKVVDGSTFYCSDTSKLYIFCKDNWYERKALGGGGGGTTYTAGDGIDITNDTISVDTDTIQEKLTAGTGIDITDNTISATGGGGGGDTVYSTKNTSNLANGGAVYIGGKDASQQINLDPSSDNHRIYFWALPYNTSDTGQTIVPGNETINIGAEQGGIGSENNVSLGYRGRCRGSQNVNIGWQTLSNLAFDGHCVTIGGSAKCDSGYGTALGSDAHVNQNHPGSVALGTDSRTTRAGEVYIGPNNTYFGYNNTKFRVIGGVHDGQLANDAVTVGQVNAVIDAINTALSTNIPHIGSAS